MHTPSGIGVDLMVGFIITDSRPECCVPQTLRIDAPRSDFRRPWAYAHGLFLFRGTPPPDPVYRPGFGLDIFLKSC